MKSFRSGLVKWLSIPVGGACYLHWLPEFDPRTYIVQENWPFQVALWLPYVCHERGSPFPTLPNTCTTQPLLCPLDASNLGRSCIDIYSHCNFTTTAVSGPQASAPHCSCLLFLHSSHAFHDVSWALEGGCYWCPITARHPAIIYSHSLTNYESLQLPLINF